MPRTAQRTSPRDASRSARTLACVAVALPALLLAGCSSSSGGGEGEQSSDKGDSTPSAAPVKFSELPDACKTVSKDSVKKLTPKTEDASGKRIGTGNAQNSGSCLWSGLDKFDYRQLTVSLKRFDSDPARGSGAKLAGAFLKQQVDGLKTDKANEDLKTEQVGGLGEQATAVSYKTDKKDGKKSESFREQRIVIRDGNVVVSVDYSGAGFEDAKLPSEKDVAENAQKAAKEAVAALK
jgi:predicted small secreted protein